MSAGTPFEIRVGDAALADLRARLANTRWPDTAVPDDPKDWSYGAPTAYIKELAQFWHDCDWRAQEAYLNGGLGCGAKHFKMEVDGLSVHYCHAASKKAGNGVPLLLLHGWPGSWFEFNQLLAPLTEAGFDCVVPSLPGFGFSDAPRRSGFGPVSMARLMNKLMHQLGYAAYCAQGGDWGSSICRALGQLTTLGEISGPKAIHANMVSAIRPPADVQAELAKGYTAHDKAGLAASAYYNLHDSGYSKIQGTKPQTIGAALHDSPAGLLSWIVEKLHRWADNGGDPEKCFSKMDMVTNVAMYWYGGAATSSARLYYEGSFGGNEKRLDELAARASSTVITVPYGFALFPKEIFWPPRSWVERSFTDIRRYEIMPRGGHFACWEQPELMAGEIKGFFLEDADARRLCHMAQSRL